MKKALWEAEMELSRAVENLQTAAGTFNSKAAELQVGPAFHNRFNTWAHHQC